jgi:hypothetical protein
VTAAQRRVITVSAALGPWGRRALRDRLIARGEHPARLVSAPGAAAVGWAREKSLPRKRALALLRDGDLTEWAVCVVTGDAVEVEQLGLGEADAALRARCEIVWEGGPADAQRGADLLAASLDPRDPDEPVPALRDACAAAVKAALPGAEAREWVPAGSPAPASRLVQVPAGRAVFFEPLPVVHAVFPAGWLSIGVDQDGALDVSARTADGAPAPCLLSPVAEHV